MVCPLVISEGQIPMAIGI